MQLALTNSNAVVYCVFPQPFSIQNGAASGHSVHVHKHMHMCAQLHLKISRCYLCLLCVPGSSRSTLNLLHGRL